MSEIATNPQFVHLHLHTQFSLLQGAIKIKELFERVNKFGMKAVAITDTNNLFGAIEFYKAAKAAGVKPIIGCEILYAPGGLNSFTTQQSQSAHLPKHHHLVVLCKNLEGYRNLCEILTKAYLRVNVGEKEKQNSNVKALVDKDLLDKYGSHLIVLSGCLRGEIPYKILSGDEEAAVDSLLWFKKRFGEDFYLELQSSGLPEQDFVNQNLFKLAEKHKIPFVATNDCHYLDEKYAEAHEILQCIENGRNLDFDRPKSLVPPEFYFKPAQLMYEQFQGFSGACERTLDIAEKCNVEFRFKDEEGRTIYHLPNYRPEGAGEDFDLIDYFRDQARKGLEERFSGYSFREKKILPDWEGKGKQYRARLEDELEMIAKTGFAGYFLIVADFINWAKRNKVPVGPGRGSGAGSLVAYSLKITDIDPIEFNLLFERFINPERISMPDFDVDFCQDRRGEVIQYVTERYGSSNVSQIITYGKLQARAVLKDVGRVLGLPYAETDVLTKLMPDELHVTIDQAILKEPRLREKIEQEPKTAKVVEYSRALEGLYRNAGIHAAGVIITEKPIVSYCPLFVGRDGDVVTQFDKDSAEAIGLVKFDFLGLKTLTVVDLAVKLIQQTAEEGSPDSEFDIERINYKDAGVFAVISSGDTDGIFQIESSGMKDLCSRIQPNSVEDLTAINALYRPGPLGSGMVDDFIDRKHGRKEIVYDVPALESILKDTYGVILYQEQVMQIARELAGYSLGQADLLRRAMGKKKPEEMAKHREIFVRGATEKGFAVEKAQSIFDLMAKFAEYGFNKSHSAAYAVLSYQTAFLKTYYPAEFMAALMTTEMDNTDKITRYIGDARAHGIPVLAPDVNRSQKRFSVERTADAKKAIRFGLEAIKGVGGIAVDLILEGRTAGSFKNVLDFCKRISVRKVNKKVLEALVLSGGFDQIAEVNRASLFASIEALIDYAGDEQAERELGQSSLFDSFSAEEVKLVTNLDAVFKKEEQWPRSKLLSKEKQVVGFYVSGHPMDPWQKICEDWLGWNTEKVKSAVNIKPVKTQTDDFSRGWRSQRTEVKLAGLVAEIREVTTKKGTRMAFGLFEDLKGKVEVIFFPDAYASVQEAVKTAMSEAEPLILTGDLEASEETTKVLVKSIELVAEAHKNRVQQVVVKLVPSLITPDQLRELKKSLLSHRGKCPVRIEFCDSSFRTSLRLPKTVCVNPSSEMIQSVNKIFGTDVVQLQ